MERLYPEDAWRRIAVSPGRESPRHGLLASARSGPSGLRDPGSVRASDARSPPCRTCREHRDGWSERFHTPRTPSPHLLRSRDLGFRLGCGSARPSLSRPRVASPRGAISGETKHRSVASVFVITREHHLASRSTLAGSTPPSARCDASPFACERLRGFYAPFADRRRSVVRSLFPLCPRLRAEARIRAPNTSWSPLRGLRYGDTEDLRASFSPGPSPRLRASPAAFALREGGCFTSR